MANNFELITKYSKEALDKVFIAESKTNLLVNGSKFIDVNFKEAGYVKVYSMLMDGLSDYYRVNNGLGSANNGYATQPTNDGYKVGNAEGSWELFKLEYDRGKQFRVDDMDDEETAGLIIGNLLAEFLKTKVVPEVDAIRFSKIAGKCNATLGNLVTENISANAIIGKFNTAFEWLTEHEVPEEEQVIFVSPAVMSLIRNTTELTKFLTQADYRSEAGIDFKIEKYGNRPIVEVPSSRFFTNVVTNQNGYQAGTGSKVINFMVVSKKAIIPVVKLEKSKIYGPEVVQDFDGYKLNFRLYHDAIIPKNKIVGAYTSISSSVAGSSKSNVLDCVAKAGATSGKTVIEEVFTTPAGIRYDALGLYTTNGTAPAINSSFTITAGTNDVKLGVEFTPNASHNIIVAVADGKVVAVSKDYTSNLPVGA